jgi:cytochrome oxidase Cu insertion factor (SCO1/SenC/PrrC family)
MTLIPPSPTPPGRAARLLRLAAVAGAIAAVLAAAGCGSGSSSSAASASGAPPAAASPAVGRAAPGGTFTTAAGTTRTIASLRGHPALVWLVATWCSSCQAGTQVMARNIGTLRADGVRVVELELYQDLGQPGPGITALEANAGAAARNPGWTWGTASLQLSETYDPAAYLDIYYLLGPDGRIRYTGSSPAATMSQLLAAARKLA